MKRTDPYTGPFPRSKHTHRCQTCLEGVNCYKKHCTKPQSVESCGWCPAWCRKPAQPVATMNTFRVMLNHPTESAKASLIVAATEEQAMEFARLHNPGWVPAFALKAFAGSPGD